MTTPATLPAFASASPLQAAPERAAPQAADTGDQSSFSKVLAGQRSEDAAAPAKPPRAAQGQDGRKRAAAAREDDAPGADAVAASGLPAVVQDLPRQTLDIAMEAAAQLRGGRGAAHGQASANAGAALPGESAADAAAAHDGRVLPGGRSTASAGAQPAAAGRIDALAALPQGEAARGTAAQDLAHAQPAARTEGPMPAAGLLGAQAGAASLGGLGDGRESGATLLRAAPAGAAAAPQSVRAAGAAGLPPAAEPGQTTLAWAAQAAPHAAAVPAAAEAAAPAPHSALLAAEHEAAALAGLAGAAAAPLHAWANPSAPALPGLQVATPVNSPQWGADLGRQLVLVTQSADGGRQTAELRLDPPDLGPLRVSISLSDGVAQAAFVSPHAAVRQAVESSLAQLQQALAQAGISLGQTSVSDQGAQQGYGQQAGSGAGTPAGTTALAGGELPAEAASARPVRSDALVDTFA